MSNSENTDMSPPETVVRHILILDDELTVCKSLSRLLKSEGHQCTTALKGEELLELIRTAAHTNTRYDLAILDIKIAGGMGGIETMQNMKKLGSAIPIVSMSGYALEDIFSCAEARNGFLGHLVKPFTKDELLNEIERLCSNPQVLQV